MRKRTIVLLDGCCKAGGCSVGYKRAADELGLKIKIIGVDIEPQPNYPYEFIQGDVLSFITENVIRNGGGQFTHFHSSPPCQTHSVTKSLTKKEYVDILPQVRELMKQTGKPFVIENVPGAPLKNYVILCGSMFGLKVRRHRLFECYPEISFPPFACNCSGGTNSHRGFSAFKNGAKLITVAGKNFAIEDGKIAMGIDWMKTSNELANAIPPAYTHWIGLQLFKSTL